MCYMKCIIILVIIWATARVTKGVKKNLEAISAKHVIDAVKKTAMLGTSHIIQNILQSETWTLSGGVQAHRSWEEKACDKSWNYYYYYYHHHLLYAGYLYLFYIHCSVHHYNCSKIITKKMTLLDYPLFQG